jgi:DNA-directed RNA polymerase alpha subunit
MVTVVLGDRYNRMFNMLNSYLLGTEIKDIAKNYGLSHTRTLQIINKSIETLNGLRPYDEITVENDKLRAENNMFKLQVAALQAELQTCRSFDVEMMNGIIDDEEYHLYELMKTKLEDLSISKRTLTPLINKDIKTLGELVQYNKRELLNLRNFGKKALTELDDLLESLNLCFGMTDKVKMLKKKYMMNEPNRIDS